MAEQRLVLLGVAASDAHAVANRLIAMHLRQAGFEVVNLGTCTPLPEFAAALRLHPGAEAVLIGSLNGHAHADLRELPDLRAKGELRRPVIVGGNLAVGQASAAEAERRLLDLGVDHVLRDAVELVPLLDSLRAKVAV
ncbi:cobalamin-dependent protein [Actinokineospora diospyrosa]|uniref:Methylaspartate mutase sigma subunit n=1 Tax=Actinokineospora diospyrosa TaxID=103728 RepID=A0ABT1IES9_9PSEU|nr:cobalamin-dependent protein [Actinokineospora diospyrosa]MCP2271152.1 methylaspartate mutase sigma subunit [Actinokineospora diospyrosa]